mmetsp:Transcript_32227/g.102500  ORF Transcript_32227/g.102500 Transcript_32227/m.102500 type:complete len:356 (+) Transcript_32227:1289-2356(+)
MLEVTQAGGLLILLGLQRLAPGALLRELLAEGVNSPRNRRELILELVLDGRVGGAKDPRRINLLRRAHARLALVRPAARVLEHLAPVVDGVHDELLQALRPGAQEVVDARLGRGAADDHLLDVVEGLEVLLHERRRVESLVAARLDAGGAHLLELARIDLRWAVVHVHARNGDALDVLLSEAAVDGRVVHIVAHDEGQRRRAPEVVLDSLRKAVVARRELGDNGAEDLAAEHILLAHLVDERVAALSVSASVAVPVLKLLHEPVHARLRLGKAPLHAVCILALGLVALVERRFVVLLAPQLLDDAVEAGLHVLHLGLDRVFVDRGNGLIEVRDLRLLFLNFLQVFLPLLVDVLNG